MIKAKKIMLNITKVVSHEKKNDVELETLRKIVRHLKVFFLLLVYQIRSYDLVFI